MKAMKKSELASQAGVTVKTFMNWCRPYREELSVMGLIYHCCLAIVNNITLLKGSLLYIFSHFS